MHAVSIIHGARSIGEPKYSKPIWPNQLANYLRKIGYGPVEPFFWSGAVFDSFSKELSKRYVHHLLNLTATMPKNTHNKISIIGKSLGAMVAESAFYFYPNIFERNAEFLSGAILRKLFVRSSSSVVRRQH